jgi:hypothetical protein
MIGSSKKVTGGSIEELLSILSMIAISFMNVSKEVKLDGFVSKNCLSQLGVSYMAPCKSGIQYVFWRTMSEQYSSIARDLAPGGLESRLITLEGSPEFGGPWRSIKLDSFDDNFRILRNIRCDQLRRTWR